MNSKFFCDYITKVWTVLINETNINILETITTTTTEATIMETTTTTTMAMETTQVAITEEISSTNTSV